MRPPTLGGHEALLYESDDELLGLAIPFVQDVIRDGEPILALLDDQLRDLIHQAVPTASSSPLWTSAPWEGRPARALKSLGERLTLLAGRTTARVRVIRTTPPHILGRTWPAWARYEAAVNTVCGDSVWKLCAYDLRTTPDAVLHDVTRTHPSVISAGERRVQDRYLPPAQFLAEPRSVVTDPLEHRTPDSCLINPTPAQGRAAVTALAAASLTGEDLDGLILAVSEVVSNASLYGVPPVTLSTWAGPDRVVVTITDLGKGPDNPFAGLLPEGRDAGGLGLWLTHQLCGLVEMYRSADGFVVRLTAGNTSTMA